MGRRAKIDEAVRVMGSYAVYAARAEAIGRELEAAKRGHDAVPTRELADIARELEAELRIAAEARRRIEELVAELPPLEQRVLTLRYLTDHYRTIDQIGDIMGTAWRTTQRYYVDGMTAIRRRLAAESRDAEGHTA